MSKSKLRESILGAQDLPLKEREIPEWGVTAFLRPLDGESRFKISEIASSFGSGDENSYITEAYVCEGLVDEKGEQIFDVKDRGLLAKKNPDVIDKLAREIMDISGMRTDEADEAEKK